MKFLIQVFRLNGPNNTIKNVFHFEYYPPECMLIEYGKEDDIIIEEIPMDTETTIIIKMI